MDGNQSIIQKRRAIEIKNTNSDDNGFWRAKWLRHCSWNIRSCYGVGKLSVDVLFFPLLVIVDCNGVDINDMKLKCIKRIIITTTKTSDTC